MININFLKWAFCVFCVLVATALFIVSSFFSIKFYKYGLGTGHENTILIITVLAICVELIKFVLSFTAPLIKDRDAELDFKINLALKLSLMLSILASLTYFLVVHSTYSPVERIIGLIYDVFLVPIGFDIWRTQVIFIFNCFFSILIEYFIILLPAISTLPFRDKKEKLIEEKSIMFMFNQSIKILVRIPAESLYGFANLKKAERELENRKVEKKIKAVGEKDEKSKENSKEKEKEEYPEDKNIDNIISFEQSRSKTKGSTGKKYEETKEAYLKYITETKNEDGSILTNKEVQEHFENSKFIFNPRKISKIKKDLYDSNILVEPISSKDGTFFTKEYLKKINDTDTNKNVTDIKNDTDDTNKNTNGKKVDIDNNDINETLERE